VIAVESTRSPYDKFKLRDAAVQVTMPIEKPKDVSAEKPSTPMA
jgi:hypothetical protein